MGKRIKNIDELKAAVREQCLAEWRQLTTNENWPNGVEWSERIAAMFTPKNPGAELEHERKIAADLHAALKAALALYEMHAEAGISSGPKGYLTTWIIPNLLSPHLFATAPEYVRLLHDGRPAVDWGRLGLLKHYAEEPDDDWTVPRLIVAQLADPTLTWPGERIGLSGPATSRTMAIVALLVGEFPDRAAAERKHGSTVPEIIEDVQKKMNTTLNRVKQETARWLEAQRATH